MNYYQQPMLASAPASMPPGGVTNHLGLYANSPGRQLHWGGGGYPEAAWQTFPPIPDRQFGADSEEGNATPTQYDQQSYYQQPGGFGRQ